MSRPTSPDESLDTPDSLQAPDGSEELNITASLEDLQTDEQRRVLDTVAQVRKCGLDSILSLPQLVVCGDQSAGKSSVLEALTEIPFPRNDNLCTRYATEIDLRRGEVNSLTIKVIPDDTRPAAEKEAIREFHETITDFSQLPRVMDLATTAMGISNTDSLDSQARAFARDVLSIQIEGPLRPQLTLVDIPGLIQTSTKGVSDADVDLVAEITDNYIQSPRTICLAVVAATNDAANQPILRKVRLVDPKGDRTLGIITKPDRLPGGSGSESKFLELARNEDVFFKLGWHVLKNRSFEEANSSLEERNASEAKYFRTSSFNTLAKENVGIDSLRARLSLLLFEHVKQELPKLRQDLEDALLEAQEELKLLGARRSKATECKAYLTQLSLDYYEVCKAAVDGHYEGAYFHRHAEAPFSVQSPATLARLRAVVQHMNTDFYQTVRKRGHKYQVNMLDDISAKMTVASSDARDTTALQPIPMSKPQALQWVQDVLARTRGKELVGNFNPLLIGELFWEQSSSWSRLATDHIEQIAKVCEKFLQHLLDDKCPKDVKSRLWSHRILDALKSRRNAAVRELEKIIEDTKSFPINYNHYYTDTIHKRRLERLKVSLAEALKSGTLYTRLPDCNSDHTSASINIDQVVASFSKHADPDMDKFSFEIIASEPKAAKRQREFLEDRVGKLEDGHEIFRGVMASGN
ncbi:hypothetical protein VE00_09921 [Pseudogymnoascus sp. WSF 3629]|nr:hypothetical protein VE00_09921 [Pseudogymnoascus sp. WSF 3629]